MMKFVAISDTHGHHRNLELPEGDAIIHAGDFCNFGSEEDMYDFLQWYEDLDFRYKILIGGNHDFFAAEKPRHFKEMLPDSITYLNDSGTSVEGINIWGSPVQPDLVGWAFGRKRGAEMKVHWDMIPENTDLLVTHCPPHGILDKTRTGNSIGSEELEKRMISLDIKVHVFGHIHESYGKRKVGKTRYFNAASMNPTFGLLNPAQEFSLSKKSPQPD